MQAIATKTGVTLKLSVEEAISLEAVLGGAVGPLARELPWYDQIADALERKHLDGSISSAVDARFNYFRVAPRYTVEQTPEDLLPLRRDPV